MGNREIRTLTIGLNATVKPQETQKIKSQERFGEHTADMSIFHMGFLATQLFNPASLPFLQYYLVAQIIQDKLSNWARLRSLMCLFLGEQFLGSVNVSRLDYGNAEFPPFLSMSVFFPTGPLLARMT